MSEPIEILIERSYSRRAKTSKSTFQEKDWIQISVIWLSSSKSSILNIIILCNSRPYFSQRGLNRKLETFTVSFTLIKTQLDPFLGVLILRRIQTCQNFWFIYIFHFKFLCNYRPNFSGKLWIKQTLLLEEK